MINDWLQPQHWAEAEFLRHAFLSHSLYGQSLGDTAKTEWEQALKSASGQKQSLAVLHRMAAEWKRPNDVEDLLWTIVERYPHETWASHVLAQNLFQGGQTQSLLRLFNDELKSSPPRISPPKNNVAMLALLLDRKEMAESIQPGAGSL